MKSSRWSYYDLIRINFIAYTYTGKETGGTASDLIEGNGEIGLEAAPVNGVHVVGRALVQAGVHLGGRIDFDL